MESLIALAAETSTKNVILDVLNDAYLYHYAYLLSIDKKIFKFDS